jgi:diguanylate cyclase (GGDEF)-like protein
MSQSPQGPRSTLDALLQIPTRDMLTPDLERLVGESSSDQPLSVLLIDLDKFEQVNDLHGHEAGDEVLQGVVSVIRTLTEKKGQSYRYGGDEIVVLLPDHSTQEADSLAERIRQRVEGLTFQFYPEPLTLSIGVACYPKPTPELGQLLGDADRAMRQVFQRLRETWTHGGFKKQRLRVRYRPPKQPLKESLVSW